MFYSFLAGSLVSLEREKATSGHTGGVIMYRHSPIRNPRSKGIKVKHVLQICLLLAVFIWLLYQVKHSHDKKKEFDQSDKTSLSRGVSNEILKLGRKDIHRKEETVAKTEKHEAEEITGEEDEEIEEEREDKKTEEEEVEEEDEGMGGGDDQIDESEEEKTEAEVDRGEDFIDEERDEGDENESEEGDSEDNNGQVEKGISLEDSDNDRDYRSTHEAREENYRADDASSAVTDDSEVLTDENENGSLGNLNVRTETNIIDLEKKENNTEEINLGEDRTEVETESNEMAKREKQSKVISNKTKKNVMDNSESGLFSNATVMEGSNDHIETINNSTSTDGHDQSLLNGTESVLGINLGLVDDGNHSHYSTTGTEDAKSNLNDFPNSSSKSDSSASENILNSEVSGEAGNTTGPLTVKIDATEAKKSKTSGESGGTDDVFDSRNENYKNIPYNPIDSSDLSIPMEEKVIRIHLDTIPDIQTEGTKTEGATAE